MAADPIGADPPSRPPAKPTARRLPWWARLGMLAIAGALAAVLATAVALEPDARGFGTHTQLGLPPCSFRAVTGVRCPSCGMTTSFAWMARGRWLSAARANPAGCLIAPAVALLVPWLGWMAATGRPDGTRSLGRPLMGLGIAAVAMALASWLIRLILWGGR